LHLDSSVVIALPSTCVFVKQYLAPHHWKVTSKLGNECARPANWRKKPHK